MADEELEARGPIRLISEGAFARLWWAGLLSSTGDWVALFATIALASRIGAGSDASETAILVPLVARVIPGLFFATIGGVLADRFDRKRIMVLSDIGRALLVLSLAFVNTLPLLFVVSLALELFTLTWQPAKEATMPNLVSKLEIPAANSLSLGAAYGTFPLGAAIFWMLSLLPTVDFGGLLNAGPEALAFGVDSLTFAASAFLITTIAIPRTRPTVREDRGFELGAALRDIAEGLRFVSRNRSVRPVVLGMGTALFGGGVLFALGESYAREELGADEAGFAALIFGLGLGAATGVIGAGAFGSRWQRADVPFGVALVVISIALFAIAAVETIVGGWSWIYVVGVGTGAAYVLGFTHLHNTVEDEFRGRTFAALIALLRTGLLLSIAVAGTAARVMDERLPAPFDDGARNVIMLGGLIVLAAGIGTLWSVRDLLKTPRLLNRARRSVEDTSQAFGSFPTDENDDEEPTEEM